MKTQFTAGPWSVIAFDYIETGAPPTGRSLQIVGNADTPADRYMVSGKNAHICDIPRGRGIAQADARLIAAAPDLLAACQAVIASVDSGERTNSIGLVRAALKKAVDL